MGSCNVLMFDFIGGEAVTVVTERLIKRSK
jgi:hypothetical protein